MTSVIFAAKPSGPDKERSILKPASILILYATDRNGTILIELIYSRCAV